MALFCRRDWFRVALSTFATVMLAAACFSTLRLSLANHADRQGTAATLASAIRLLPDDSALLSRYAAVSGEDESLRALNAAVSVNPADWAAWIRLGVRAEVRGDFQYAESCYRRAAALNRQFQPAWNLANYFFRRWDREQFGVWAGRALAMAYGDAQPVFDLCWRADPRPDPVLRAISGRRDLLRQYLAYSIAAGRQDAADAASDRVLAQAREEDLPVLLSYCDRLLEASAAKRAAAVWNELSRRRLIRYQALDPARAVSLTNGDFEAAPSSMGFDWRVVPWNGVSVVGTPVVRTLRVTLTGEEPESCEILTQYVPVEPNRRYLLSYEYRTHGEPAETGLGWRIHRAGKTSELADAAPQLSSEDWGRDELRFSTGADDTLARIALVYQRTRGTTRFEGSIWLRHIRLD